MLHRLTLPTPLIPMCRIYLNRELFTLLDCPQLPVLLVQVRADQAATPTIRAEDTFPQPIVILRLGGWIKFLKLKRREVEQVTFRITRARI